jgi:hypothetical protein
MTRAPDQVDTVASQFVAYLGGRIRKVAIHHSVQADDGSVWCFSEDTWSTTRTTGSPTTTAAG